MSSLRSERQRRCSTRAHAPVGRRRPSMRIDLVASPCALTRVIHIVRSMETVWSACCRRRSSCSSNLECDLECKRRLLLHENRLVQEDGWGGAEVACATMWRPDILWSWLSISSPLDIPCERVPVGLLVGGHPDVAGSWQKKHCSDSCDAHINTCALQIHIHA